MSYEITVKYRRNLNSNKYIIEIVFLCNYYKIGQDLKLTCDILGKNTSRNQFKCIYVTKETASMEISRYRDLLYAKK